MRAASDSSTSLDRGLSLLAAIIADRGRTPLARYPALAGSSSATRHRLIASLIRAGFVTRVGRGRYDVGATLARGVGQLTPQGQIACGARKILRRLARDTGLTAHLGILEDEMVTYLVKAPGRAAHAGAAFTREGGQLEAYCSAIGKVLLAHVAPEIRLTYLAGAPFVALTERTITIPAELDAQLDRVRAQGYAVDDREISPELYCIAVPVVDYLGQVEAAVSVSMTDPPGHDAPILAALRAAAEGIAAIAR